MKNLIRLEEAGIFTVCILFIVKINVGLDWWLYLILFFSPDIGMLGYLVNTKAGAVTYNLFHHKGLASLILIAGIILNDNYLLLAGLMLMAHASFDRILGYGLKYQDSFKHTHTGYL